MKTIPLKKIGEGEDEFDYKKTIESLLKHAPLGSGFTLEEVRLSVKILEKLEKATSTLSLEDTEHEHLKKILERSKFNRASKELFEFITDTNG